MTTSLQSRHTALLAASVIAVFSVCLSAPAEADPPGWKLAWRDDFNKLDNSKWILVDERNPTNNSLQDYLPGQVSVRRGKLIITAENRPSRGRRYRSGQVVSRAEQKHGRWEVRAKMPTGRGMWPAIWLLPDTDRYPWPSGGEIDIVENRGNQPHLTSSALHYGAHDPFSHKSVLSEQRSALQHGLINYHNSFHVYAVDWAEDRLRFYVDGVHHYTVYDEDVDRFLTRSMQPMRLVINNAIGGDFLPDPNHTTDWPQKMEIDWVKVYQPDQASFAAELRNGGFDEDGGTLAGWSVFGNRTNDYTNVSVTRGATRDNYGALKVFGTFSPGPSYSGVSQGITVDAGDQVTASVEVLVNSSDSIAGSDNTATLKIEFYDRFGGKHGGNEMLGEQAITVANGDTEEDAWRRHELTLTVPERAKEARVSLVFCQPGTAVGAAVFDEVRFSKRSRSKTRR